jgi:hypothetical protein
VHAIYISFRLGLITLPADESNVHTATWSVSSASSRSRRESRPAQFYILTQVSIDRYSTQAFPDFVPARIFAPLGMTSTSYSVSAGDAAGTAAHVFTKAGRRIPV